MRGSESSSPVKNPMPLYQDAEKFINDEFHQRTHDGRSRMNIPNLIEAKLIKDNKEKDPEYYDHREGVVHSSSLYSCLRGTLYSMLGFAPSKEPDGRKLGVFKAGNLFEDYIIEALGDRVLEKQREYNYTYKNLTLVGRSDYRVEDEGIMRIGENKSVHSDSFWMRQREGTIVAWHNQIQLQIYMWLERVLFGNEWEGIFSYISKDDCMVVGAPVKFNQRVIDEVVIPVLDILDAGYMAMKPIATRYHAITDKNTDEARAVFAEIQAEMAKIPAPDIAVYSNAKSQWQKNWLCTYCDFHDLCAGAGWVIEATNLVTKRNKEDKAGGMLAHTVKKIAPTIGIAVEISEESEPRDHHGITTA